MEKKIRKMSFADLTAMKSVIDGIVGNVSTLQLTDKLQEKRRAIVDEMALRIDTL